MVKMHFYRTLAIVSLFLHQLFAAPAVAAQQGVSADVVGEVTSVIGRGTIRNTLGEQSAARGQLVRAGDHIETTAGGHVHVRFIDGGLVSVRPLSRLVVEDYRNRDAQNLAAIKFRLDVGVIRSVTGQWGEANRDRFRLNTPVAAIGIKGTDFIVKAQNASTLVSVNTGAIVMAPLEGSCAAALGPCTGERSALLSAEMSGKMLEYLQQSDKSVPRLVPYADLLARNTGTAHVAELRQAEVIPAGEAVNKTMDGSIKETVGAATTTAGTAPVTPSLPLAWLHNPLDWNVPVNTISTRFSEASAAGRSATVGNFFITLYRDETVRKDFTPPALSANFALTSASASYTPTGRMPEMATVSDAKLAVDFAKSTLTTQMNLASPTMGQNHFAATTIVTPQGMFVSNIANQKLAGAFSTDARQAGYLFEKNVNDGTVSGLTLWGR